MLIILILLLFFISKLPMLILVQTKNEQDQVHIFQYTYLKSFQIHLQAIIYRFEHIDHDTRQDFLFQILPILFEHGDSLHLQYLLNLICCKRLLYRAMKFKITISKFIYARKLFDNSIF